MDGSEYVECLAIRDLGGLDVTAGHDPVTPALAAAASSGEHMVGAGVVVERQVEVGQTYVECQTWNETHGIQNQSIHDYN